MSEMAARHRRDAANTSARRKESVLTPDACRLPPSSARKFPQMTTRHFLLYLEPWSAGGFKVKTHFAGATTTDPCLSIALN